MQTGFGIVSCLEAAEKLNISNSDPSHLIKNANNLSFVDSLIQNTNLIISSL